MASRLGSKAASRSATHFGWGVTCTDIGSPPRALELWKKDSRANVAPRFLCTSLCGLTTCAVEAGAAVSVITVPRLSPIDTIYRAAISLRYIANLENAWPDHSHGTGSPSALGLGASSGPARGAAGVAGSSRGA